MAQLKASKAMIYYYFSLQRHQASTSILAQDAGLPEGPRRPALRPSPGGRCPAHRLIKVSTTLSSLQEELSEGNLPVVVSK